MKRILSVLALSAACGLAACNSDGSFRTANNDDRNMNGNPDTYNSTAYHDAVSPAQQTAGNRDVSAARPDVQLGQGNDKQSPAIANALTNDDRDFIKNAGAGGMYEVQSSEKALSKSNDAHIKDIAHQMIDDHTKANDQLKALAMRKGVDVPALTPDQVKMLAKLDSLNGSDFDREYLSQQKTAHNQTIAQFQWAANSSSDRDIRDWAAMTLPTLRNHLNMINNATNSNVGTEK